MGHEAAPQPAPKKLTLSQHRAIKREFGVNPREAAQPVTWGDHTSKLAEILLAAPIDPATGKICPFQQDLRQTFQEEGREGVERSFMGLSMASRRFENPIPRAAAERNQKFEQRQLWNAEKKQEAESQKKNNSLGG